MRYRLVPQQDMYGCGVSAVAVVLGTTYDKSKKAIQRVHRDFDPKGTKGLTRKAILSVLSDYRRCRGAEKLSRSKPDAGTIVLVASGTTRHYLVFDGKFWLDSLDYIISKSKDTKVWRPQKRGQRHLRIPRGYQLQADYLVPK